MKQLLLLLVVFAVAANGFAQTKKIAHRSHSGKNATMIMDGDDNFGLPKKKNTAAKSDTSRDSIMHKDLAVKKKIKSTGKKKKSKLK